MITGVRHTGIVVSDIEAALKFWVDLLGFKIQSDQLEVGEFIDSLLGLKNVSVRTIKLSAEDGTLIELLYFNSHKSLPKWDGNSYKTGLTHIALNVKDINVLVLTLELNGYSQVNKFQRSPSGKVKVCYINGFEGLLIELVENLN